MKALRGFVGSHPSTTPEPQSSTSTLFSHLHKLDLPSDQSHESLSLTLNLSTSSFLSLPLRDGDHHPCRESPMAILVEDDFSKCCHPLWHFHKLDARWKVEGGGGVLKFGSLFTYVSPPGFSLFPSCMPQIVTKTLSMYSSRKFHIPHHPDSGHTPFVANSLLSNLFVQALRIATEISRMTTAVTVYQASENVYDLFDKVCIINEGRMVYYGPTSLARQYFIDMGYQPANRQTTPDFLVAITDPNTRIAREGYESRVPRTADEFADHYRKSNVWQINQVDMDAYCMESVRKPQHASAYMESARAEHAATSNKKSSYVTSIPMQTRAVMVRRLQVLKSNAAAQIANVVAFHHRQNRVPVNSEYDGNLLLERWCPLLVRAFSLSLVPTVFSLTLLQCCFIHRSESHG